MTDRIEPAWNADMLSWIQNDPGDVRLALDRGMDNIAYDLKGQLPNLIALANAALSDDDPRKITREWVRTLHAAKEWEFYATSGSCPKCDGSAFKMSMPPICIACGWRLAMHPDTLIETLGILASALESYLPPE